MTAVEPTRQPSPYSQSEDVEHAQALAEIAAQLVDVAVKLARLAEAMRSERG